MLNRPGLYREARFHPKLERFGPFAAPVARCGLRFRLATMSRPDPGSGECCRGELRLCWPGRGATRGLLARVGSPFSRCRSGPRSLSGMLALIRRHSQAITIVSVAVMAGFGVLLLTDKLTYVTSELETLSAAIGLGRLIKLG